jgi:hypothetical protein
MVDVEMCTDFGLHPHIHVGFWFQSLILHSLRVWFQLPSSTSVFGFNPSLLPFLPQILVSSPVSPLDFGFNSLLLPSPLHPLGFWFQPLPTSPPSLHLLEFCQPPSTSWNFGFTTPFPPRILVSNTRTQPPINPHPSPTHTITKTILRMDKRGKLIKIMMKMIE